MGQKVSPIGFRTGVTIGWKSRWFAPKSNYGEFLVEDAKVRRYIGERLNRQPPYAAISRIEIERTREEVKVVLWTARPGLVIGPRGAAVDELKGALEDLTNRRVNINIVEIRAPDLDAQLVAEGIAEQLKRRSSFRRAIRQRTEASLQAGAKGIKVMVSGRLMGKEIARSEKQIFGSIPLHTLEADVDYGFAPSFTNYGTIGVKVWIYRGMFGEDSEEQDDQVAALAMTRARRRREGGRGDGRHGGRPGQDRSVAAPQARPGGSRLGGRARAARATAAEKLVQATAAEEPVQAAAAEEPVQTAPPPPEEPAVQDAPQPDQQPAAEVKADESTEQKKASE